jgi:hypothetical protein
MNSSLQAFIPTPANCVTSAAQPPSRLETAGRDDIADSAFVRLEKEVFPAGTGFVAFANGERPLVSSNVRASPGSI